MEKMYCYDLIELRRSNHKKGKKGGNENKKLEYKFNLNRQGKNEKPNKTRSSRNY